MKIAEIERQLLRAATIPDMGSLAHIVSGLTEEEGMLLDGKVLEKVFHIVISYTKNNSINGSGAALLFIDKLGHRLSQNAIGSALGHLLNQRRKKLLAVG